MFPFLCSPCQVHLLQQVQRRKRPLAPCHLPLPLLEELLVVVQVQWAHTDPSLSLLLLALFHFPSKPQLLHLLRLEVLQRTLWWQLLPWLLQAQPVWRREQQKLAPCPPLLPSLQQLCWGRGPWTRSWSNELQQCFLQPQLYL
jgi:hypothetical protein